MVGNLPASEGDAGMIPGPGRLHMLCKQVSPCAQQLIQSPHSGCREAWLVAMLCSTLATPWTVALQAPLSMGFSTQEYWSEESYSRGSSQLKERTHISMSLTLAGIFFTTSAT